MMDESKGAIFVFKNYKNDYTYQYVTCYNLQLNSASKEVIFFHHVPKHNDSLIVVTKKEALYVKWCRKIEDCVYNFNRKQKGYIDETVTYVCATITYDGEYIILADSAGFISVWNADSGFQPVAVYKSRVISLDSFWLIDQDCHVVHIVLLLIQLYLTKFKIIFEINKFFSDMWEREWSIIQMEIPNTKIK